MSPEPRCRTHSKTFICRNLKQIYALINAMGANLIAIHKSKWRNVMAKNPITDGTHEDHVRAGEQSHKNTSGTAAAKKPESGSKPMGMQGGTHEQHVKAGEQSHKKS